MASTYETIDRPYDSHLSRDASAINGDGASSKSLSETLSGGSGDSSTAGTDGSEDTKVVKNGEAIDNLSIRTFIQSASFLPGIRGFKLDGGTGKLECMDLFAKRGEIGGWSMTPGSLSSGGIVLDSDEPAIKSSNFSSGASGFKITTNTSEFNNVRIRGVMKAATFQKDTVSSVGGHMIIAKGSDTLDVDMTAADNSTVTIKGDDTFSVNDVIRIKEGTDDEWMTVTNVSGAPTYVVTRDAGGSYTSNNNPIWKKGATVTNYGATGQGVIEMSANDTNIPWMKVNTHTGSPWSSMDTKVIVGQLQDKTGSDEYGLWVKSGAAYVGGYRLFDAIVSTDGLGDYDNIASAVASGAKRIFIRNGTYTLTAHLSITDNNINIEGETRDGVVIASNTPYYGITVTGDSFNISNLTLANLKEGSYSSFLYLNTISGVNIKNCLFTNTGVDNLICITAIDSSNVTIENCETRILLSAPITNYSIASVWVDGSLSNDIKIVNNLFRGRVQAHLYIGDGENIVIDRNLVFNEPNGYTGISFTPSNVNNIASTITPSSVPADKKAIKFSSTGTLPGGLSDGVLYYAKYYDASSFSIYDGNSFDDVYGGYVLDLTSDGTGIHTLYAERGGSTGIEATSQASNITISSNKCSSLSYQTGSGVNSEASKTIINNNTFIGYKYGLYIDSNNNTSVSGNNIIGSGEEGIHADFNSNTGYGCHVISNNTIYRSLKYGIYGWPVNRATFANNHIYQSISHGFYGSGSGTISEMLFTGNFITENGGTGLFLDQGASSVVNCNINGNSFSNNSGYGIRIPSGTSNLITSNYCLGNTYTNFSVTSSGTVTNNYF